MGITNSGAGDAETTSKLQFQQVCVFIFFAKRNFKSLGTSTKVKEKKNVCRNNKHSERETMTCIALSTPTPTKGSRVAHQAAWT